MTEQASISTQQIVEKVWLSIAERRLRPGVQLKEGQLADIFDVSRARIRQALAAHGPQAPAVAAQSHNLTRPAPTLNVYSSNL